MLLNDLNLNFYISMHFKNKIFTIPGGPSDKESTCQCRRCKRWGFDPWVSKISWTRKWHPTLVLLPGKFHGQRSLVGYTPWDLKELDTIEHKPENLAFTFIACLPHILCIYSLFQMSLFCSTVFIFTATVVVQSSLSSSLAAKMVPELSSSLPFLLLHPNYFPT